MSIQWNKTPRLLAAAAIAAALIVSGCSKEKSPAAADADNAANAANTPANEAPAEPAANEPKDRITYKWDPPVTITTAIQTDVAASAGSYKAGENHENNMHKQWMLDNMGIDVKYDFVVAKDEDYDTKLRLLLASGGRLPDVFNPGGQLPTFLESGKLLDVTDAVEKYGSPTLKALMEKYPLATASFTKDGRLYGVPTFQSKDDTTVMWVRQDWLDALKLTPPKTIDELEAVMKAFTEQDPDQNGKKDTFGLAVSLNQGPVNWMAQAGPIVGAYSDFMPNLLNMAESWMDEGGKLVHAAVHESQKQYLGTMQKWMKAGYIDNEAAVKDPMKASEMFVSGKAGIIFGPNWMAGWPLGDTVKTDPKAVIKALPLPTGPDGRSGDFAGSVVYEINVFNKDFQHIEAWFDYYNKVLAKLAGPEDPYFDPRFKDGWHEGYDYIVHEGKVLRRDLEKAGVPKEKWFKPDDGNGEGFKPKPFLISKTGNMGGIPYSGAKAYEKFYKDPNAEPVNEAEIRIKSMTPEQIEAGYVGLPQIENYISNQYMGPITPSMSSKGERLTTMAQETYLEIIYGKKSVDDFDTFVKEWYAAGGQAVTDEVNAWYDKQK